MKKKIFPSWGPYGKKYMGFSHIAKHDFADGVRFDLTVVPSLFGDIRLPNVTLPSGCHPWESSADYSLLTYRFDLLQKDLVYANVSYVKLDEDSTLIRTELVNHSNLARNCVINFFESIEFPAPFSCQLQTPDKTVCKDARDYTEYQYAKPRPWDEQNSDGFKKGEFMDEHFVGGFGLGDRAKKWHMPHAYIPPFGAAKGDFVSYDFDLPETLETAVLTLRYRTCDIHYETGEMVGVDLIPGEKTAEFEVNGKIFSLAPTDELALARLPLGKLPKGKFHLCLTSLGKGAAEFDFLCLTEEKDCEKIIVKNQPYDFTPEVKTQKAKDALGGFLSSCHFPHVEGEYILRTFQENTRFRRVETGALEDCMSARLANADPSFDDLTESFTDSFSRKHSDDGFFWNTILHTIFVSPNSRHIEYAVISKGETEYLSAQAYETIYQEKTKTAIAGDFNGKGRDYALSVGILRATLMANAVYPIYKHGENIIHHTPGKRWDCLYTWDSGFIGLGMLDFAPAFAEYSLKTYLSEKDNPDYAFLLHGSPVPVQMYLYLEMLKRAKEKTELYALYDSVKLYYDFLAGKIRGSTTAKFKSGLTTTYDYFYNSSGMDDYPAQVEMMARNLRDSTAPVISSSQLIRCAKILSMVASHCGHEDDLPRFQADIERLTGALNTYAWDEESGYYGYVLHDENYAPIGIMRTKDGENLNKGLDGIYPLIAGACDSLQKEKILAHLKSEKEMLSPFGISAVDMSASYFKVNGYWNGHVWFPHQWFIWKTMLDLGETEFARKIASLALNIWKREVDDSYYTFEMVNVVTGCGGWFHNFGGLSSPISIWANAYYTPGTFSTGFEVWVESADFSEDYTRFTAKFSHEGKNLFTVILVMNEKKNYRLFLDDKEIPFKENNKGTLEIELQFHDKTAHTLTAKSIE